MAEPLLILLNLTEKKEIGEVLTTGRGENVEKHAIQSVVLLPPKLTKILRSFKVLDPSLLLLKFVEFIRSELQMKQTEREMDEEDDASEAEEGTNASKAHEKGSEEEDDNSLIDTIDLLLSVPEVFFLVTRHFLLPLVGTSTCHGKDFWYTLYQVLFGENIFFAECLLESR